ncbi:MAG: hypothetical protein KY475_15915 [Planctomycetes bacterium]|nr:hypothetical protein [Planctomycetota bacterium]
MAGVPVEAHQRQWFIVQRWQAFDGERRANLLRILAVGAFYGLQLANYYLLSDRDAGADAFHRAATALAAAWTLAAITIALCLRGRVFPRWLPYLATAADIFLLTGLAVLTQSKANSAVVFIYFLVLALAALRFSVPLMWFATLGCMAGYLAVVGMSDPVWFDPDHAVPPIEQFMVHLSLALCGVVLGQIVRRAQALADDFAQRITSAGG